MLAGKDERGGYIALIKSLPIAVQRLCRAGLVPSQALTRQLSQRESLPEGENTIKKQETQL